MLDVSISAPQGHVLAGTLTTPKGAHGNVPAAVLITGLSPSEGNGGSPLGCQPLRDLADALTRVGIAVLRVDDRGIGKSTGDHKPSTTYDANDVRTEVAWLRSHPGIDPKRDSRAGRVQFKKQKEVRALTQQISAYARRVHQQFPTGDVVVSERDLAEHLRKRTDIAVHALNCC